MKAIFFNAEGHRVKALSANTLRRRSFFKPGERGTRRYPFKCATNLVAHLRATYIGEDICCEVNKKVSRVSGKDGSQFFLYKRP